MNESLADVTVHIDETLDHTQLEIVTAALRAQSGVGSVTSHDDKPHLVIVKYDPEKIDSQNILKTVTDKRGIVTENTYDTLYRLIETLRAGTRLVNRLIGDRFRIVTLQTLQLYVLYGCFRFRRRNLSRRHSESGEPIREDSGPGLTGRHELLQRRVRSSDRSVQAPSADALCGRPGPSPLRLIGDRQPLSACM